MDVGHVQRRMLGWEEVDDPLWPLLKEEEAAATSLLEC